MTDKKSILLIGFSKFGYNDYYHYVKHLSEIYDVDYWGINSVNEEIEYLGRNCFHFEIPKQRIGFIGLIVKLGLLIRRTRYDYIIFRHWKFAFLVMLIAGKNGILDIRSVDVCPGIFKRTITDLMIKINAFFFKNVLTLSPSIVEYLNLNKKKTQIVPLGADITIKRDTTTLTKMNFLYVGTLNNRNIHETIKGLSIFAHEHKEIELSYTIVGSGSSNELLLVNNAIEKAPSNLKVTLTGFIPYPKLHQFYLNANIGVSYVPLKKWYKPQPVTKTYEYLHAGLVVIATALPANEHVINDSNGVIIEDNAIDFARGVVHIHKNIKQFNLQNIAESAKHFQWKYIIENYFTKALLGTQD